MFSRSKFVNSNSVTSDALMRRPASQDRAGVVVAPNVCTVKPMPFDDCCTLGD
jgi:hypothetical protein